MKNCFEESQAGLSRKIIEMIAAIETEYSEAVTPITIIRDESGALEDICLGSAGHSDSDISLGQRMVHLLKQFAGTQAVQLIKDFERENGVTFDTLSYRADDFGKLIDISIAFSGKYGL